MVDITHLTTTTGRTSTIAPGDVSPATEALLREWLPKAIRKGSAPLPVRKLSHFSATVLTEGGGVVVTVNAPAGPHATGKPYKGAKIPLVTFGIAPNEDAATDIWTAFIKHNRRTRLVARPQAPWCATILYPTLPAYKDAANWLGDFERCVAWVVCNG